jgi:hypothetical protein
MAEWFAANAMGIIVGMLVGIFWGIYGLEKRLDAISEQIAMLRAGREPPWQGRP